MKAADGVQIAERWAAEYDEMKTCALRDTAEHYKNRCLKVIEDLSLAEERERVLREALTSLRIRFVALFDGYVRKTYVGSNGNSDLRIALMDTDAALTLERDTLKAERDERAEQVRRYDKAIGVLTEDNAALKAKVERLSAPVSDEEWTNVVVVSPQHDHRTWMERKQVDAIIAARASTPPSHPINYDEQLRKDAGWNAGTKARCVCGEIIARYLDWYSGEYLHVANRSKSCADGRLASPAHFLVGMPLAEPEW